MIPQRKMGAGGCEIGVDTLLLDKDADIRELIRHTPFERIDVLPLSLIHICRCRLRYCWMNLRTLARSTTFPPS